MVSFLGSRLLLPAGFVVMVSASFWAPQQPELINLGAACNVAPCGTLQDPARWQAAWVLWAAGLVAVVVPSLSRARPGPTLSWAHCAVAALLLPIWAAVIGFAAALTSLFTSVHGAATVAASGLLVPALAMASGQIKRRRADPTR